MGNEDILRLRQMITGYWLTQAIYVVAKLGIPDLFDRRPISADKIAKRCDTDPDLTYRTLRALASQGLFRETHDRQFVLTRRGRLLRTEDAHSLRYYAIWYGEELYQTFAHFLYAVETGESGFRHVFGKDYFEWLKDHPQARDTFQKAMSSVSGKQIDSILKAYDFSPYKTIVDLGGGYGDLLSAILLVNPESKGILFDLEEVVEEATSRNKGTVLEDRCTFIAGDFFETVPSYGDLYVLKYIVHDWGDERVGRVLDNCRGAMAEHAKLIVIEQIVSEDNEPLFAKLADLHMHMFFEGKERTRREFEELFRMHGFEIEKIIPSDYLMHIVELRVG